MLSNDEVRKILLGMTRLWLCDSKETFYESDRCRTCDNHDNCIDLVLCSAGEMSEKASNILEYVEAQQKEIEQLTKECDKYRGGKVAEVIALNEMLADDFKKLKAQNAAMSEKYNITISRLEAQNKAFLEQLTKIEGLKPNVIMVHHNPSDLEEISLLREQLPEGDVVEALILAKEAIGSISILRKGVLKKPVDSEFCDCCVLELACRKDKCIVNQSMKAIEAIDKAIGGGQ